MIQSEQTKTHGEEQSEEFERRQKRKKWGCCLMGCAVPIGIVLLVFAAFLIWRMRAWTEIQRLEEEITAKGQPINVQEVDAAYRIPEGVEDKTELFLLFLPTMENEGFLAEQTELPIVGKDVEFPCDPAVVTEDEEAVFAFLEKHTELLEQIKVASLASGETRFALRFEDGFNMLLTHVQRMRGAARLLDLQARLQIRNGEHDKAFRTVRALLALGESIRHEPIIISQLVRVAVRGVAVNTICEALPHADWTDEQLKRLMADLRSVDWRNGVKTAMIGERAMGRSVFSDPDMLGPQFASLRYLSTYEDQRFHLEHMTKSVDATELPFPEMMDEMEKINIELAQAGQTTKMTAPLSMIVVPALDAAVRAMARADANDKAVEAQLAIELYRRKHGKLPTALEELVPELLAEVPIDAFNGKPLIYRVDPTEILIYTVYNNRVDDGGVFEPDMLDYVVRVQRKAEE